MCRAPIRKWATRFRAAGASESGLRGENQPRLHLSNFLEIRKNGLAVAAQADDADARQIIHGLWHEIAILDPDMLAEQRRQPRHPVEGLEIRDQPFRASPQKNRHHRFPKHEFFSRDVAIDKNLDQSVALAA